MDSLFLIMVLLFIFWMFGFGLNLIGGLIHVLLALILILAIWKVLIFLTERKDSGRS